MIEVLAALLIQSAVPQEVLDIGALPDCGPSAGPLVREGERSVPEIGEERSAEIGEPLLASGRYIVRNSVTSLSETLVVVGMTTSAPFTLTMPAGSPVVLEGPGYRPTNFVFEGRGPNPTSVHFETAADGRTIARISWGWLKERHPVTTGTFNLNRGQCISVPRDSLKRQISFTGVSRGVVSLEYREFSGDLARPAFTQSATYDLADGRTIGFRGARIEVISADNIEIRYRVLRPFE